MGAPGTSGPSGSPAWLQQVLPGHPSQLSARGRGVQSDRSGGGGRRGTFKPLSTPLVQLCPAVTYAVSPSFPEDSSF